MLEETLISYRSRHDLTHEPKHLHASAAFGPHSLTRIWEIPPTSPLIRPFDRKLLCCCARTPHVQWDAWDHLRVRPFARMQRPFAHMLAAFSLPPLASLLVVCSSTRSFALLSCIIRVLNHLLIRTLALFIRAVIRVLIRR